MARKKTITRDQILNAAYQLVVEEGFKSFTARNIAKRMDCSTQPIYLEFTCMDDLKNAVIEQIKGFLASEMKRTYTDNPVIDLALAYIHFALDNRALYNAVFVEDHFGVETMKEYALETGMRIIDQYPPAKNLPESQRLNTITGIWIVATGIANLSASGFIDIDDNQMIEILEAVTDDFIKNGRFNNQSHSAFIHHIAAS